MEGLSTPPEVFEKPATALADRLLVWHPTIAVLYMSCHTDETIVQHGVLEPGTQFIQKPFTPGDVARRVREVLDARSDASSRGDSA